MRSGNFSVTIPEGREKDNQHVVLPHGTQYRIRLGNHWHDRRADARVVVDGKDVGTLRLERHGVLLLETSPDDPGRGKFTFFKADSSQADLAGVEGVAGVERGLISVTFKPEKKPVPHYIPNPIGVLKSKGPGGQSAGGWLNELTGGAIVNPHSYGGAAEASFNASAETETAGGIVPTSSRRYERAEKTSAGITGLTGQSDQKFFSVAELDYDPAEEVTIHLRLVCGDSVRPLVGSPRETPIPPPVE